MNIIKYRKIYLLVSGSLVLASIISIFFFGFRQGIDFVGGTLWEIKLSAAKEDLRLLLPSSAVINPRAESGFLIRMEQISEKDHQQFLAQLKEKFGEVEELRFDSIGPAIGNELKTKSIKAFLLVLLAISLYVAFAFRQVSYPVSSWKYAIITLVTLFHDAIIPLGVFSVLGRFMNVEIDTSFVVAILVVLGFSVHDTIVVFDRIRENLKIQKSRKYEFNQVVNDGINQTLVRSINTSLTLVLVLLAMFFFGAPTLQYFVLAILIGVVAGTYSSIFIASPLLTFWKK